MHAVGRRCRADVQLICKCAQCEFRAGQSERGGALFENLLATYPKRIDLWSVYVDLLVKAGDVRTARWASAWLLRQASRAVVLDTARLRQWLARTALFAYCACHSYSWFNTATWTICCARCSV